MTEKNNSEHKRYWTELFWPAISGLLVKDAVLGYLHSRGKLPTNEQIRLSLNQNAENWLDTLPYSGVLGTAGMISTVAGLVVATGAYYLFNYPTGREVSESRHQGTLATKQQTQR